jgi:GT2 family glycosyltransferase
MKKYNIAISLICCNDEELLKISLESLLNSDIKNHELKLFCYDNNSNKKLKDLIKNLEVNKWIYFSENNDGIVIPRIKIYKEIIKEDFDFILEIHSDMVFPKIWSEPLFDIFDENTGILEPHIYVPNRKSGVTVEFFEGKLPSLLNDIKYDKCRQTHPWIINMKIIDKVGGYYDEIFSPHECEDDDFVFRVLNNNFKIKSTALSWVVHYGGSIRHNLLPNNLSSHIYLFEQKNKISFQEFIKMFEIHPYYAE